MTNETHLDGTWMSVHFQNCIAWKAITDCTSHNTTRANADASERASLRHARLVVTSRGFPLARAILILETLNGNPHGFRRVCAARGSLIF